MKNLMLAISGLTTEEMENAFREVTLDRVYNVCYEYACESCDSTRQLFIAALLGTIAGSKKIGLQLCLQVMNPIIPIHGIDLDYSNKIVSKLEVYEKAKSLNKISMKAYKDLLICILCDVFHETPRNIKRFI